jgi:WD40 repeat protein
MDSTSNRQETNRRVTLSEEMLPPTEVLSPARERRGNAGASATISGLPNGNYEILRELGQGGMSVVYLARQRPLNRLVALKMLLLGRQASTGALERFRREAAIIAGLQHANVIHIYEVGELQQVPFLALELCEGGSLADRHGQQAPHASEAAGLVEKLARAVHAAHNAGIIHRDLKPANILFLADGTPKITDFGLAKRLDADADQTHPSEVVGTPCYMAPEQTGWTRHAIGPAADVYALGAILYQLLTGQPPFRAPTSLETLTQVVDKEPVRPRQLQPKSPRDLETICLKCLAKDPARRYGSAATLAEDLRRFQAGESIIARPPGLAEKTTRWVQKRPLVAGLGAALLILLVVGFGGLSVAWGDALAAKHIAARQTHLALEKDALARKATRAEKLAEASALQANAKAKQHSKEAQEATAEAKEQRQHAQEATAAVGKKSEQLEWTSANNQLLLAQVAGSQVEPKTGGGIQAALAALEKVDSKQRMWEWYYLKRLYTGGLLNLEKKGARWTAVAWSPDGAYLAAVDDQGAVQLWEAHSGRAVATKLATHTLIPRLVFRPGSRTLALCTYDGAVRLWDWERNAIDALPKRHQGVVLGIGFSADGRLLASGGADNAVRVWDVDLRKELYTLHVIGGPIYSVAFSPNGTLLAAAIAAPRPYEASKKTTESSRLVAWDLTTRQERFTRPIPGAGKTSRVVFRSDGKLLATADGDGSVGFWDVATGNLVGTGMGHRGAVLDVAFQPAQSSLASCGQDGTVRLWSSPAGKKSALLKGHVGAVSSVCWSPDGTRLATAGMDGTIKVWDPADEDGARVLSGQEAEAAVLAFHPDGCLAAAVGPFVCLYHPESSAATPTRRLVGHRNDIRCLCWVEKDRLLSVGNDQQVILWDTVRDKRLQETTVSIQGATALAFSANGHVLAVGRSDGTIQLWDWRKDYMFRELRGSEDEVIALAFSPDDRTLLCGCADETVRLVDIKSGEQPLVLRANSKARGVAFTAQGNRLITGHANNQVLLWDARTGQLLLRLSARTGQVCSLAASPDDRWLAAGSGDRTITLWEGRRPVTAQDHR